MTFGNLTEAERLDAVQVGDVFEQKKTGRQVTITDRLLSRDGYYTVLFTDDKGKPRSRWAPYFLENFTLRTRGGEVPVALALTRPIADWDTDMLRRLAVEIATVLEERQA